MPQTLAEWLSYLESLHPKTIALGLERVAQVKQRLNLNPTFPVIVVGGTNGKGSTCAMLESIYHAAGYRVACYTSPHLLRYNERVRVDKQQVSDQALCDSFAKIEQARGDIGLTYFEFGTLAAMLLFIEQQVDVAILEVGLGGRLDAVNVFDNDCAVITSVDIDHTDYLGDTREKIAFEKAGIFRAGKVAICADNEVPTAMRDYAQQIAAPLWCITQEFGFTLESTQLKDKFAIKQENNNPSAQWSYHSPVMERHALPYPALRGAFQLNNASAVLAATDVLKSVLPVSMEAVRRGLTEVTLAGRFQFIPGRPTLILDVAHNPHAARSLAQNLANLPPCSHTFAVFSMLKDKDICSVVQTLDPYIDTWLIAGLDMPRGASATELQQLMGEVSGSVFSFVNIASALDYAYKQAGENDRIVAFGSFYTVADVMSHRKH